MTKGDNLFGIETYYKGIKMRSKLEAKFAVFLDALKINWMYEPKSFVLSNGITYIPDFYLPELNTWVEVKGKIEEHNKKVSSLFTSENKQELLIISNNKGLWYSSFGEEDIYIGLCSHCGRYFFCGNMGSYHCRSCNEYEGDHDIKYTLQSDIFCREDNINFYDLNSIEEGLKRYGAKI